MTPVSPLRSLLPPQVKAFPAPILNLFTKISGLDSIEGVYGALDAKLMGADFAARALQALDIRVALDDRDAERIPRNKPVIIAANHPFGMIEGLAFAALLERLGFEFRFLANEVLGLFEPMRELIIPVDVFGGAAAVRKTHNVPGLRNALRWLKRGGVLVVFPSGEVSSWKWKDAAVLDSDWNPGVARLATLTGASVVPAFFEGSNSVPFQLLGMVHPALRTMRLPAELDQKRGSSIRLSFGRPIPARQLGEVGCVRQQTGFLRARTELLRHRGVSRPVIAPALAIEQPCAPEVRQEIERLADAAHMVAELGKFRVLRVRAAEAQAAISEIGRLREIAFRQVGEGTGHAVDLDTFDAAYDHLILWDSEQARIAGGYRLRMIGRAGRRRDPECLYTSTTFRYGRGFLNRLGEAIELGRSFLSPGYQREFSALLLLWRAILRVAEQGGAPVLFGAVSISARYEPFSRALMAEWLKRHAWRADLAPHIKPVHTLQVPLAWRRRLDLTARALNGIEDLSTAIGDLEADGKAAPVLLRQYLKQGGRVACLGVDPAFGNCLDGLIVTDLRQIPAVALQKIAGSAAG